MVNVSDDDECFAFYIFWLRTMTESTWKIQKLKTAGIFFFQKSGNPILSSALSLRLAILHKSSLPLQPTYITTFPVVLQNICSN